MAAEAAKWNLLHYAHDLTVNDPHLQADAAAFRSWTQILTRAALGNPTWTKSFLAVATKEADYADTKASRIATARFTEWLQEGPANGLRRQHLFSRVATGWIPAKPVASLPPTCLSSTTLKACPPAAPDSPGRGSRSRHPFGSPAPRQC